MKVEVPEHAELEWSVKLPCRMGFEDGHNIDEVKDDFHGKERDEEANTIQ